MAEKYSKWNKIKMYQKKSKVDLSTNVIGITNHLLISLSHKIEPTSNIVKIRPRACGRRVMDPRGTYGYYLAK